jgi:hypothetical protein
MSEISDISETSNSESEDDFIPSIKLEEKVIPLKLFGKRQLRTNKKDGMKKLTLAFYFFDIVSFL